MAMRARDSLTTRGRKKKRGKKQCELGASCPYKDEYQHSLEFAHVNDVPSAPSTAASSSFRAFSGAGYTMVSTTTVRASRPPSALAAEATRSANAAAAIRRSSAAATTANTQHSRSQRYQSSNVEVIVVDDSDDDGNELENMHPFHNIGRTLTPKKRTARSAIPLVDLCGSSSEVEEEDGNRQKQLPRCRSGAPVAKRIRVEAMRGGRDIVNHQPLHHGVIYPPTLAPSRSSIAYSPSFIAATSAQDEESQLARAIAASNRDILSEQDQAYYESLKQDEEKEHAKREVEQNKKEEAELFRALEESVRLAEMGKQRARERERQYYTEQLQPEPTDTSFATVAFRLPTRCSKNRIERKFRDDAGADQLLAFLHGCEELQDIDKWSLWEVVGGKHIEADKLLRDLGLVPRGIVVVRDDDS